jgi:hypothetical protein
MGQAGCVLEEFKHGVVFVRMLLGNEFIVAMEDHHHYHWLDSPWWALAFLGSCAHSSPLTATFLMSSLADQSGFNSSDFVTIFFSRGGVVSPTPNPQQSRGPMFFCWGCLP